MGPRTVQQTPAGLGEIATKIDAILGRLRGIEGKLRNPGKHGPRDLAMPVDKAENAIEYLDSWSQGLERKLAKILADIEKAEKRGRL